GNVPRAAAVTFLINFFLGTIVMITVPSMIVPGVGAAVAALRAYSWGVLLGPALVLTARAMLPHSGTMLLEGEGYILATFFALLIPIPLFPPARRNTKGVDPAAGDGSDELSVVPQPVPDSLRGRFTRAVVLNLQGAVWVALTLAVAAVYE